MRGTRSSLMFHPPEFPAFRHSHPDRISLISQRYLCHWEEFSDSVFEKKGVTSKYSGIRTYGILSVILSRNGKFWPLSVTSKPAPRTASRMIIFTIIKERLSKNRRPRIRRRASWETAHFLVLHSRKILAGLRWGDCDGGTRKM